jgi:hypothetical protein
LNWDSLRGPGGPSQAQQISITTGLRKVVGRAQIPPRKVVIFHQKKTKVEFFKTHAIQAAKNVEWGFKSSS